MWQKTRAGYRARYAPIAVGPVPDVATDLVFEHLAEITAIDPAAAGWASDEILCLALGLMAHSSPEDGAAGNI